MLNPITADHQAVFCADNEVGKIFWISSSRDIRLFVDVGPKLKSLYMCSSKNCIFLVTENRILKFDKNTGKELDSIRFRNRGSIASIDDDTIFCINNPESLIEKIILNEPKRRSVPLKGNLRSPELLAFGNKKLYLYEKEINRITIFRYEERKQELCYMNHLKWNNVVTLDISHGDKLLVAETNKISILNEYLEPQDTIKTKNLIHASVSYPYLWVSEKGRLKCLELPDM